MRTIFNQLNESVESINFQDNSFFTDLTKLIGNIRNKKANISDIDKLVKKRLGFTIKTQIYDTDVSLNVGTWVPTLSETSPLYRHYQNFLEKVYFAKQYEESIETLKNIQDRGNLTGAFTLKDKTKTVIDLTNAKIHGFLSDASVSELIIDKPVMYLTKFLTNEELAAVILHELGHTFTYFEYIDRNYTTNQVLFTAFKTYTLAQDERQKEYCLSLTADKLDIVIDSKELSKSDANVALTTIVMSLKNKRNSELGSDEYDYTASEQLADQFAVRFGTGQHLATALNKLFERGENFFTTERRPFVQDFTRISLITVSSGLTYLACLFVKTSTIASFLVPWLFFGTIIICASTLLIGKFSRNYDNDLVRFKRIKEDMISHLKLPNISDNVKKSILEQIKKVDSIIATYSKNKGVFRYIYEIMNFTDDKYSVSNRNAQMKLQRKLEEFSSNDLFVHAAELSLIK